MAKKKEEPPIIKMGAPEWMVTFGDMMTLLLCFFVLLFAMSEIDAVKMRIITSSVKDWSGTEMASRPTFEPQNVPGAELENSRDSMHGEQKEGGLADQITLEDVNKEVQTLRERPPVSVTTGFKLRFEEDSLQMTPEAKENLFMIADILRGYPNQRIEIIGHAKSTRHLKSPKYIDLYELGYKRARLIHDKLIDEERGFSLKPSQFKVTTVANYFPPVSASWEIADLSDNDRVEIIVTKVPLPAIKDIETKYRYNIEGSE